MKIEIVKLNKIINAISADVLFKIKILNVK